MNQYRVVVGVLGILLHEECESEAQRQFNQFVIQSQTAGSEYFQEPVTLFKNYEIIRDCRPP